MKWFNNIQKSLHQSSIKKQNNLTQKNISSFNVKNARSMGILFDATLAENVWKVLDYKNFVNKKGIEVSLLGYINDDKPDAITDLFAEIDFITKKDLNWLLTPVSSKSKDFIKKQFDLLLNFYTEECLPLQYVSASSKAKYRIGCFNNNNLYCNDLLIKMNHGNDLEYFISQVKNILN